MTISNSSQSDSNLSSSALRNSAFLIFVTLSMGLLAACHMLFFGISDIAALLLFLVAGYLIFRSVLDLRMGSRKALRVYVKKESPIATFLSQDKTWSQIGFSFLVAAFLSLAFIVVLKGMSLSHGFWSMLIIIMMASLLIRAINISIVEETVSESANDVISHHAVSIISIVMMAFWLNLLLSMALSAHDLFMFLGSTVDFSSFVSYAEARSIGKTVDNGVSRFFVNIYVIVNSFKIAMANEVMAALDIGYQDKSRYFYIFYITTLVMNVVKLFGFSLTLVFIQKSLEERVACRASRLWGKVFFVIKKFNIPKEVGEKGRKE